MTPTLIAGLVLLAGMIFLMWKGKATLGLELIKMFSEKRVLLLEIIAFVLVLLHAHIAADLGVKLSGAIYIHRFAIHASINFVGFVFCMNLYKNGRDVGNAIFNFTSVSIFLKEFFELVFMLAATFFMQWVSLLTMCVGFKKPYLAFLHNSAHEPVGFVDMMLSLTDFSIVTSMSILFAEAAIAIMLTVTGSASAVKAGTTTTSKGGGFLSGLASMFGGMFKVPPPKDKSDKLAERIAQILGRPPVAATAISKELDRGKRNQLNTLVNRWEAADGFNKHSLKSEILNAIEA
jgi:hypothetical protein